MDHPRELSLAGCGATTVAFGDATFEVWRRDDTVRIVRDAANEMELSLRDPEVNAESSLTGGPPMVIEHEHGRVDHRRYFVIDWDHELGLPGLVLQQQPTSIARRYSPGQAIELGLEPVRRYRVVYSDGVEATIERRSKGGFQFRFSTGCTGSCWKEADGSTVLRFKGDTLSATDASQRSPSKLLISRSKYSDNLLFVMQAEATVFFE